MKSIKQKPIRRGDLYWCDFGNKAGSVQQGYRPVIVLQADTINIHSETAVIAPLTGVIKKQNLFSHIVIDKRFGLDMPSMILIEQITTVNQSELKNYIGKVSDRDLLRTIRTSIMKTLGIWYNTEERTGDVRCLCKKHLDEYKLLPNYIIKRFDPLQVKMDKCDKCDSLGYDYLFFKKEDVLRKRGATNE